MTVIAKVMGLNQTQTVDACITLQVRDDKGIRMSILYYVPPDAVKDYFIGQKFEIAITRKGEREWKISPT